MNKISGILASLPVLAVVTGPVEAGAAKEYTLTTLAEKREEQIIVSGKTNLPDGCVLGVFIERPHWERGDETNYAGLMAFGVATVENGRYEVSLTPDDRRWYDNAITLIELGLWTDFERTSDNVTISVIFTPKRDQPDSVYAIVGNNAENLMGEQVEVSGYFRVLRAETTLNMYFIPPIARMPTSPEKPTVNSIEIGYTIVGNWEMEPERYDVADGIDTIIYIKDQIDRVIDAEGGLILELYERRSDVHDWEAAMGRLLGRWEETIRERSIRDEAGGYWLRLIFSEEIPPVVKYGILQATLITPDGKRFYAVKDRVPLMYPPPFETNGQRQ